MINFPSFILSIILLLSLLLLLSDASPFASADVIEFRRGSKASEIYADNGAYYDLWAKNEFLGWLRVCSSPDMTDDDAKALCAMQGLSTTNAKIQGGSFGLFRAYDKIRCKTQTGNATNFNQCTLGGVRSQCTLTAELRCGGLTGEGGSRGIYIDGSKSSAKTEYFIRRRYNGQIQLREIFKTQWQNLGATAFSEFSAYTASSLCAWSAADTDTTAWRYMTFADPPALDYEQKLSIANLKCLKNGRDSLDDCSYPTSVSPPYTVAQARDQSVSVTCTLGSNDLGVEVGANQNYLRLVRNGNFNFLEITFKGGTPRPFCYINGANADPLDVKTRNKVCSWLGYGPKAVGKMSPEANSQYTDSQVEASSLICDSDATVSTYDSKCSPYAKTSSQVCAGFVALECSFEETAGAFGFSTKFLVYCTVAIAVLQFVLMVL